MPNKFEDVKIVAMNDKETINRDPALALFNVVLELSCSPPYEWQNYFNDRWKSHIYTCKRQASVSGHKLTIYCVPNELQSEHIPELNKVISETNLKYRGT